MTEHDTNDDTGIARRTFLSGAVATAGVATISSTTSAQENNSTDSAPNGTEVSVEQEPEYLAAISGTARVLDYSIERNGDNSATITVEIENDEPQLFVLSDVFAGLSEEGVSNVSQKRQVLPAGDGELSMRVSTFDDEYAAVGVATTDGAVTVSTGLPGEGSPDTSLPFGVGIGVLTSGLTFAWGARRERDEIAKEPESVADDDDGVL